MRNLAYGLLVACVAWAVPLLGAHGGPRGEQDSQRSTDETVVRPLKVVVVREQDLDQHRDPPIDLSAIHPCGGGVYVLLEVDGPSVRTAIEFGRVKVTRVSDDSGRPLAPPVFTDKTERINRETMFFGIDKPPADSLWIPLDLPLPDREAQSLAVTGSLQLVTTKRKEVQFSSLEEHTGFLDWQALKEAGVSCAVSRKGSDMTVVSFEGNVRGIIDANIVEAKSRKVHEPHSRSWSWDTRVDYLFWLPDGHEGELTLKAILATETRETTVPFRLAKLPLP